MEIFKDQIILELMDLLNLNSELIEKSIESNNYRLFIDLVNNHINTVKAYCQKNVSVEKKQYLIDRIANSLSKSKKLMNDYSFGSIEKKFIDDSINKINSFLK